MTDRPNPESLITLYLSVFDAGRKKTYRWRPELPPGSYLTDLELVDSDGDPILRAPFYFHEGARSVHTICGREDPTEVDRLKM